MHPWISLLQLIHTRDPLCSFIHWAKAFLCNVSKYNDGEEPVPKTHIKHWHTILLCVVVFVVLSLKNEGMCSDPSHHMIIIIGSQKNALLKFRGSIESMKNIKIYAHLSLQREGLCIFLLTVDCRKKRNRFLIYKCIAL